jgi:hypothetical protein
MRSPTARLIRRIIALSVNPLGYVIDGNHIFTLADAGQIIAGNWRASVIEKPARHPAKIQRAAELLARTYR